MLYNKPAHMLIVLHRSKFKYAIMQYNIPQMIYFNKEYREFSCML